MTIPSKECNSLKNIRGRGSLCHIASVPYDILAMVFGHFVPPSLGIHETIDAEAWDCATSYGVDCPCSTDHADIVVISQVCRQWRKIALDFPSFWNPIWITDHDYALSRAPEFLRRSYHAPLEVAVVDRIRDENVDFPLRVHEQQHPSIVGPSLNPLVSLMNLHGNIGSFIKVLHITSTIPPTAEEFFKTPMPLLESLYLDPLYDTAGFVYRLPEPFFGDHTPNLRKVSLKSVDFSWNSPLFKNLTFLRIWDAVERLGSTANRIESFPLVTLNRLFQIMSDCPNLVTLDLAYVGPEIQENFTVGSRVTLPHLRHLILSGMKSVSVCSSVLSGLKTPNLQRLQVQHFGISASHIDVLLPADFSFNPIIANTQTLDVSLLWGESMLEVDYMPDENLRGPQVFETCAPRSEKMEIDIDVVCKFRYESFDCYTPIFTGFYLSFIQRFSSPQIPTLVLCDLGRSKFDLPFDSRALLNHFSSVQYLEIHNGSRAAGRGAEGVLDYLRMRSEVADDEEVALPSLRTIALVLFDFTQGFDNLRSFLHHRKERSVPLETLEIEAAKNLLPDILAHLKELVGVVLLCDEELKVNEASTTSDLFSCSMFNHSI